MKKQTLPIQKGPFDPSWKSLRTFQCPDWFRDAKFGIWSHWGPQSVPMYGDWYARNMYKEDEVQYHHHWRQYGHPSKHGYKDIVKLWKAERFDPDALMDLYAKAGARYFVAQAVHHDNFDNWNSRHNRWNAVKVGPGKNIVGMWQKAARKHGLPFGLSEHLGASFSWFCFNKGCDRNGPYAGVPYDGNLPAFRDLYHANRSQFNIPAEKRPWLTTCASWHAHWFKRMKDLVDQHQPDLLYSDSVVPFDEVGRHIIAHLYNTSVRLHGTNRAVYNQKDSKPEAFTVGVLDIERGVQADIVPQPWQTDTSVGDWFYNVRDVYKTPGHVIEMLVDIVSKNGNLLLNIPQRPDGTLDEECVHLLNRLSDWTNVNGEGIYATRPWKKAGEGATESHSGSFKEDAQQFTPADFRFTARGKAPAVTGVRMLGRGRMKFRQDSRGLHIVMPAKPLNEFPHGFCIEMTA